MELRKIEYMPQAEKISCSEFLFVGSRQTGMSISYLSITQDI